MLDGFVADCTAAAKFNVATDFGRKLPIQRRLLLQISINNKTKVFSECCHFRLYQTPNSNSDAKIKTFWRTWFKIWSKSQSYFDQVLHFSTWVLRSSFEAYGKEVRVYSFLKLPEGHKQNGNKKNSVLYRIFDGPIKIITQKKLSACCRRKKSREFWCKIVIYCWQRIPVKTKIKFDKG